MADERNSQKVAICKAMQHTYLKSGLVIAPLPAAVVDMLDIPSWLNALQAAHESVQRVETRSSSKKFRMADVTHQFPSQEVLVGLSELLNHHFGLEPASLELFTAFAVYYATQGFCNNSLELHTDNSYLTVNLCLLSESTGSAVCFDGSKPLEGRPRRKQESQQSKVDIPAAWVLLHWGNHPHQTLPIETGERWNVIMWFKKVEPPL